MPNDTSLAPGQGKLVCGKADSDEAVQLCLLIELSDVECVHYAFGSIPRSRTTLWQPERYDLQESW